LKRTSSFIRPRNIEGHDVESVFAKIACALALVMASLLWAPGALAGERLTCERNKVDVDDWHLVDPAQDPGVDPKGDPEPQQPVQKKRKKPEAPRRKPGSDHDPERLPLDLNSIYS
jgi:hypothetical protein